MIQQRCPVQLAVGEAVQLCVGGRDVHCWLNELTDDMAKCRSRLEDLGSKTLTEVDVRNLVTNFVLPSLDMVVENQLKELKKQFVASWQALESQHSKTLLAIGSLKSELDMESARHAENLRMLESRWTQLLEEKFGKSLQIAENSEARAGKAEKILAALQVEREKDLLAHGMNAKLQASLWEEKLEDRLHHAESKLSANFEAEAALQTKMHALALSSISVDLKAEAEKRADDLKAAETRWTETLHSSERSLELETERRLRSFGVAEARLAESAAAAEAQAACASERAANIDSVLVSLTSQQTKDLQALETNTKLAITGKASAWEERLRSVESQVSSSIDATVTAEALRQSKLTELWVSQIEEKWLQRFHSTESALAAEIELCASNLESAKADFVERVSRTAAMLDCTRSEASRQEDALRSLRCSTDANELLGHHLQEQSLACKKDICESLAMAESLQSQERNRWSLMEQSQAQLLESSALGFSKLKSGLEGIQMQQTIADRTVVSLQEDVEQCVSSELKLASNQWELMRCGALVEDDQEIRSNLEKCQALLCDSSSLNFAKMESEMQVGQAQQIIAERKLTNLQERLEQCVCNLELRHSCTEKKIDSMQVKLEQCSTSSQGDQGVWRYDDQLSRSSIDRDFSCMQVELKKNVVGELAAAESAWRTQLHKTEALTAEELRLIRASIEELRIGLTTHSHEIQVGNRGSHMVPVAPNSGTRKQIDKPMPVGAAASAARSLSLASGLMSVS